MHDIENSMSCPGDRSTKSLLVRKLDGRTTDVPAMIGRSIMQIIRDAGIDELMAVCGGGCFCATCHVYFDPDRAHLVPSMSDDEDALLDGAAHRKVNSRLSCQLSFTDVLDGAVLEIAPAE